MNIDKEKSGLRYKKKGVVENGEGLVAGFWIKQRKGHRETFLFEKPIKRVKPYRIEHKTITAGGKVFRDVPVRVYPLMNSLNHWGKYSK